MISIKANHFHSPLVEPHIHFASESNKLSLNTITHVNPLAAPKAAPTYYTAPQLRQAYNVSPVAVSQLTKKVKIAIVIAFTYSGLLNDLNSYWKYCFGASSTCPKVTVYTMPGATFNAGWAEEECLDVQMVCAMAPNADIYVVEAKSNANADLMKAVDYASNTIKADVLSMSWGYSDSAGNGQSAFNGYFSNPNVCYCAATGDSVTPCFPSTLANVLACGGTTLSFTPSLRQETTWTLGGSGYSKQVLKPLYQKGVTNINSIFRSVPDISAIANPSKGVLVCYQGNGYIIGGTSVSTPLIAGILGNVIQNRYNNKTSKSLTTVVPPLSNSVNLQTLLYNLYNNNVKNPLYVSCFNDVVLGTDGPNTATPGYDLCTGLGSLNCTELCSTLMK